MSMILIKIIQKIRIVVYRLCSTRAPKGFRPVLRQPVLFLGEGEIYFHKNVRIGFFPSPHFLSGAGHIEARGPHSLIQIGADCSISNDFSIIADRAQITIGERCLIGSSVTIFDSDFHGIAVPERNVDSSIARRSVNIGDDVFIGSGVTILKGVCIGRGSVVAAGSIVSKSIPEGVIAAGNPARVVRGI